MKKISLVIAVPLLVVAVLVAIVFAIRLGSQSASTSANISDPRPGSYTGGEKQVTGYLNDDLTKELEATQDDGGASDFTELQKFEQGL